MSFNGSGTFQPYVPGNPVVTGTVITSTAFNATISDIAAGLSNAVTRDGQSPPLSNLPMAGQKLTGLGPGLVAGDSVRFEQLPSASNQIATALIANNAVTPAKLANGGSELGTRNKIINGNPLINQRSVSGTVVLTAGAYGHDRWKAGAGGCTYTFATSANVTTITISAGSLIQVVEGLNLQTGTHILSWTGTAQGKIGAGSYAASGVTGSITGGTNTNVEFNTGTLSLVQLELGTTATPFEHRLIGAELALCQRYLPAFVAESTASLLGGGFAPSSTTFVAQLFFPVEARIVPTGITISNAGHFSADVGGSPFAFTAAVVGGARSRKTGSISFTGTGMTAGQGGQAYIDTSGGFVLFEGCEL